MNAVVALPKHSFPTEAVSGRLLRSLPHPDRSASLPLVAFAPDGRLIVGGYPSGVVQVFDPLTGQELRTLETPRGYRGSFDGMRLSKDAGTLFVALGDSTSEPIRDGEKKTYFRRYNGETRVYDLNAGVQRESLKVEPRRGVSSMAVSSDGTRVATTEFASGRNEDFDKLRAMYLWDVPARTAIKLRDGYGDPRFSADGQTLFIAVDDYEKKTGVLYAYAAATGREVGKWASADELCPALAFNPDGRRAAAARSQPSVVRLYDPATLAPQAALTADGLDGEARFGHVTFSPDGRRIAAVAKTTVYLWDIASGTLLKSWPLDTPGRIWHLTFAADGQRLAASTWFVPPELKKASDEVVTPRDYPQPKVFLIDVTAAKPETIVCPHGWWGRPAFSPDGKLLAVGGAGATHLFDVRVPIP